MIKIVSVHIWTNYRIYRIYTMSGEPIRLHVPEIQYPVFGINIPKYFDKSGQDQLSHVCNQSSHQAKCGRPGYCR